MPEMSTEMYTRIELTYDELFLIEMAIDEVLYRIEDTNSPIYQRLHLLNMTLYERRKNWNKEEPNGNSSKDN